MNRILKSYLSEMGRRGGRKSKRQLDRATARSMVKVREAKRAFSCFYNQCFWSFDPEYEITAADVPWVAQQLMKNGGRNAWEKGAKLCR
jgi:hypothetical protein